MIDSQISPLNISVVNVHIIIKSKSLRSGVLKINCCYNSTLNDQRTMQISKGTIFENDNNRVDHGRMVEIIVGVLEDGSYLLT